MYGTEKALINLPLEIYNSSVKQELRLLSHIAVNQNGDRVDITFPYFSIMQEILKANDFTTNTSNINNDNDSNSINSSSEDNNSNNNDSEPVDATAGPGEEDEDFMTGQRFEM